MQFDQIKRRAFVTLLGGAAAAWPLSARAQEPGKVFRVGFLGPALTSPVPVSVYQAFLAQMRELGFIEGKNVAIEYRGFDDPRGAFVGAAELMRLLPDLIVAVGPEASLQAVVGASRAIPIVMIAVDFDPLARGYVASLARPGGNITGVVFQQLELAQKRVELLMQAFPERTGLAVLYDALSADQFRAVEQAAKSLNPQVLPVKLVNPPYDFDAAFRSVAAGAAQMILFLTSAHFVAQRSRIAELTIAHRLPAMFSFKFYVEVGGLMSYGVDFPRMYRRAAEYVAKVLKGTKADDLPVEQPTQFELVINLKTAKALGLEMPPTLLARADEVIE
jgi:putative ABC transport system substrate-binding protein